MYSHRIEAVLAPLLGSVFGGCWPSDMLPTEKITTRPIYYVVNTHDQSREGEHWIAIMIERETDRASFFDSFGLGPDYPHYPKSFMKFLSLNASEILYNRNQVQDVSSSSCGAHAIFVLCQRHKGISFNETIKAIVYCVQLANKPKHRPATQIYEHKNV